MGSQSNIIQQGPEDITGKNDDNVARGMILAQQIEPETLRPWLQQHGGKKLVLLLDAYLHELRLNAVTTTTNDGASNVGNTGYKLVHKTLKLLRHMIGSTSWKTPAEVLHLIHSIGSEVVRTVGTNQQDPSVENIFRRVMATIREEANREGQDALAKTNNGTSSVGGNSNDGGRLSLQGILWTLPPPQSTSRSSSRHTTGGSSGSIVAQRQESLASEEEMKTSLKDSAASQLVNYTFPASYYTAQQNFKVTILEAVQEIISDLEDMHRSINEHVMNYIHAGEIILTCGNSETIELFLIAAHNKIKQQQQQQSSSSATPSSFTVIVCGNGHNTSSVISQAGIDTTYIENSSIFAVMTRVNKVILPVHAVLANGGLVAPTGSSLVALAAQEKAVPVICITGLYKLCPVFPHDGQDTLQKLLSPVPSLVPKFGELHSVFDSVELINPSRDYIEPKLVSLYITNVGSFPPSFIYRLLAENYHIDDWKPF